MFSECFILDCCAVIAAKTGKFASSVQVNCIHTHVHTHAHYKPVLTQNVLLVLLCVQNLFYLFVFFI